MNGKSVVRILGNSRNTPSLLNNKYNGCDVKLYTSGLKQLVPSHDSVQRGLVITAARLSMRPN